MRNETKDSKQLSYLLRHNPQAMDLIMDKNGWVNINQLIEKSNGVFDFEYLEQIVLNDNKNRYSFNQDKTKIRANQGHSINIDLELKSIKPPNILYHGTAIKFLDSINKEGIKKQTRSHVHLSSDINTAKNVGSRHGEPVILNINAKQMYEDGYEFYLSENKVWLTNFIPSKYIKKEAI